MAQDYNYQLAQILSQKRDEDLQRNPFVLAGRGVSQGAQRGRFSNDWKGMLAQSLANIAGGALQGYGEQSVADDYSGPQGYMTQLSNVLNETEQPDRDQLLASDEYSGLRSKVGDIFPMISLLEKSKKAEQQKELQSMVNKAQLEGMLKNPYQKQAKIKVNEDGSLDFEEKPEMISPLAPPSSPGKRNTLNEEIAAAAQEARQLGVTPGDMDSYIARKTKPLLDERTRAEKELEEKSDQVADMERIAREAEQGISQAGKTGGILGGVRRIGDQLGALVGSEAATQKMAGDTILDRVAQAGIGLNRTKGAGALSDFESKALYSSFISKNKTPEENQAILTELEKNAAIEKEYLGFKRSFLDQYGHTKGAQTAWEGYKKLNPIVISDESGRSTINMERKPWQEYDFTQLEQVGKSPSLAKNAASSIEAQTIPGSDMVTIRNKRTGELKQVPRSMLGQ